MELTARGVAQAVFDRMAAKGCDELEAKDYVYRRILAKPEFAAELWREEGLQIINSWANAMLHGFNGNGPRPTVPANHGRNRRRERATQRDYLDALIRVPSGVLKPIGELTGSDLDAMSAQRKDIANRNLYVAGELDHLRSFVADSDTLASAAEKLDKRADTFLRKLSRQPEPEEQAA
jgi:hypothetical protein